MRGAHDRSGLIVQYLGIIPACAGSSSCRTHRNSWRWDHPRVCGEQAGMPMNTVLETGSSPRVRGAAIDVPKASIAPGIIPACAGSSSRQSRRAPAGRDHPRACGEQELPRCGAVDDLGIIPARAGNSLWRRLSRQGSRDHPRACGEQVFPLRAFVIEPESSPRVRGAAAHRADDSDGLGIIPACAGSSPRTFFNADVPGSSPRVRGAADHRRHRSGNRGIIPACTGSRGSALPCSAPRRDHPRVCGEQVFLPLIKTSQKGSSPRVRGAGERVQRGRGDPGIIPACAGSRTSTLSPTASLRDHPRVCGEQLAFFLRCSASVGSSPRVRGAAHSTACGRPSCRIIPARAGSSRA